MRSRERTSARAPERARWHVRCAYGAAENEAMITTELMAELFPYPGRFGRDRNLAHADAREELVAQMNIYMPRYGVNTYLRVAGFLGCTAVETDAYKTTTEYGGVAYFTRMYETNREKAVELGNTERGDGARFRGRGLMQTTGRYNYGVLHGAVGREIGVNVVRFPERLAEIPLAVQSACFYFEWAGLAEYADASQWRALNGRVNRGDARRRPLHWPQREEHTNRVLRVLPRDFSFAPPAPARARVGRS
jgi:putative chitinase